LESNEFSESGGLSTEDVEDTYYQRIGCNFDAETAVEINLNCENLIRKNNYIIFNNNIQ
jgi:hypothetical protein